MSFIANTRVGVIRRGVRNGLEVHLLECPGCGHWQTLDDDQWHGRATVDHRAKGCAGYQAIRNFAAVVAVAGGFRAV